ncbi:MAG: hypothetical protein QOF93_239 [Verrucomicrobiota bacterium]
MGHSKRGPRGQIFFDAFDQLLETDRLGQEWMSLDPQARPSFDRRHKSRQKDNRYSVQCRIGLNPGSDFATIGFRHRDIEEDKIGIKALGCLMSFVRVVLLSDDVAARPLQHDLGRVGKIAVVIDYQDACFLFNRLDTLREKVSFNCSVHNFLFDHRLSRRLPNRSAD